MANEFTDLSRPNPASSAFFNSPSSTQISPFSQSSQQAMLRTRGSSQNGQNPSGLLYILTRVCSTISCPPMQSLAKPSLAPPPPNHRHHLAADLAYSAEE
jgi:hypothetical protein